MSREHDNLKELITRQNLRKEAGDVYFKRGLDYFKAGQVQTLHLNDGRIEGKVAGSRFYHCSIESDGNGWFSGECSCPLGDDGEFCKHLVALGLAFIEGFETPQPTSGKRSKFDLAAFLKAQSKEELMTLLSEAAKLHPDLLEFFRMSYLPDDPDSLRRELLQKIDHLLELAEECSYVDCYGDEGDEIDENFEQLRQELGQLTQTMKRVPSSLMLELAEYAIKEALKREGGDDENGLDELIGELLPFYFDAVTKGAGKPLEIVENMIEWEAANPWGALGKIGRYFMDAPQRIVNAWEKIAQRQWKEMPELPMGARTSHKRELIEKRLLQRTRINCDKELELKILQKNQSSPEQVLALSRQLFRLDRYDEILPLLQKAHDHFKGDHDILNALVNELIRCDRKEEALALAWNCFERYPDCRYGYEFLRSTARYCHKSKVYLAKALDFLRNRLASGDQAISARTEMVNILIGEKDYPQALEVAEGGLCAHQTLYCLADAIAETRPEASARLIKRPLDQYLPQVGDRFYAESVRLLKLYQKYLTAAGERERFQQEILAIRLQYKPRRKFIGMLDKEGLK
ncbi:SWIM zinc finger domain-containing protein [Victivallis sp. Marseille-Q1083]|uniref:SWIM zinc finger family protein n=1 Tax=Victivallis sp. Marseille-Q1083 TaxID=2717288 RepID=UPI00158E2A75|nr:hypothetical protein [Victivallis sp. Marseille-Q1083]